MKRRITSALAISLLLGSLSAPARASRPGDATDEVGDIVVMLKPGVAIDAINSRYHTQTMRAMQGANIYKLRASSIGPTVEAMNQDPQLLRAGRDRRVSRHQTFGFPNDSPALVAPGDGLDPSALYRSQLTQGPLADLGIDSAAELTASGAEVTVAVLDTGVDAHHPAVASHLWQNAAESRRGAVAAADDDANGYVDDVNGYDFVDDDAEPDESGVAGDIAGHGTFICGLIALAAPSARIMPLRVLDGDGHGSAFDAAAAVNYAVRNGAKVISMSFGTDGPGLPTVLHEAIRSAHRAGVVVVAAAGNDAAPSVAYPASDKVVVAVGSSDGDKMAEFTNYGAQVDVSAPGVGLVSAMPGSDGGAPRYARWSGTSFSTALAAAACSSLLSVATLAGTRETVARLRDTGDAIHQSKKVGNRINFLEAVGSVFRDAGALDVWTQSTLVDPAAEGSQLGWVTLRTIGRAERVSAHACGLTPQTSFDFVAVIDGQEHAIGSAVADALGVVAFVASDAPTSAQYSLPGSINTIDSVRFKDPNGGVACEAHFGADSAYVQSWGGVGLKGADRQGPRPYGWAWYQVDGAHNETLEVAAYSLPDGGTYELRAHGVTVCERTLAEGESQVVFHFSTADAGGFPAALDPVAEAGALEIYRTDGGGAQLVVRGNITRDE